MSKKIAATYLIYEIILLARDVGLVPTGLTLSGRSESHW